MLSSSGYSKPDLEALKSIPPNARVDGLSWLVRQNKNKLPCWYSWIASDTSLADDDEVVIPTDNPGLGRWIKADASRIGKVLSGDRTYYVSAVSGNDSSDGLTPQTSFATIQKFIDTLTWVDLNGFVVTCNVIPQRYSQSIQLKSVKTSGGLVIIDGGDSTNTIIQADGDCVWGNNVESPYLLSNLTFSPKTNGGCTNFYKCSDIKISNCNFAASSVGQIISSDSSITVSDCDISGNAPNFIACSSSNIKVDTPSGNRSISAGLTFNDAFIKADEGSRITFNAGYTGSQAGVRYNIRRGCTLDCGVNLASIPGSLPGIAENSQVFETNVASMSLNGNLSIGGNLRVTGNNSASHIKNIIVDDTDKAAGKILRLSNDGNRLIYSDPSTSSSAIAISDEGTLVTTRMSSINFTGAGVTATSSSGTVTVSIPGGGTAGGSGDMSKSVYDSDNDGIVDNSEALQGQNGAYYRDRSNHTGNQLASTISDFSETVDDRVAGLLRQGTGINLAYDDTANTLTISSTATSGTSTSGSANSVGFTEPSDLNNVLLLHFEGSTFVDSSGTNKTINDDGSPQISTAQFKFSNSSGFFDGASYLTVAGNSDFDLSTTDFTIEFFVYFNSVSSTPHLFQIGNSSSARFNIYLSNSKLGAYYQTSSTSGVIAIAGTVTLVAGQWYHVAYSRLGTTTKLFLNGNLEGSSTAVVVPSGTPTLAIASQNFTPISGDYLNGYVAEFRLLKGRAEYTANFTPPTSAFANPTQVPKLLDNNARVAIAVNGTNIGTRRKINLVGSITATDDPSNEEVDITFNSSSAGSATSSTNPLPRSIVSTTTASIANNATDNPNISLAPFFGLLTVTSNRACRVRLYSSSAARLADASRNSTTPVSADSGVIVDVELASDNLSLDLTPVVWGANLDAIISSTIYAAITNLSGATSTVAVSFAIATPVSSPTGRETLTADRTYFVSSTGSDSNSGLTSANAFLTIQKAIDVTSSLDLRTYNVTIQLADGTYTVSDAIILKSFLGGGQITIQGNITTPTNVLITTPNGLVTTGTEQGLFSARSVSGIYRLRGFRLASTATSNNPQGLYVTSGSYLEYELIDFGSGLTLHMRIEDNSSIKAVGNYSISGGSGSHFFATGSSTIRCQNKTITILNNPNFPDFANCRTSIMNINGNTFSGTATGRQYSVIENSVLVLLGSFLPGNTGGATATGGQVT